MLQVQFLLVLCCLLQSVVFVQRLTTSPASSASIERVGFSTFSFIHNKSFLLMNFDERFKFLVAQSLVQWCVAGSIPAGVMLFAAVCGVGPKTDNIISIFSIN